LRAEQRLAAGGAQRSPDPKGRLHRNYLENIPSGIVVNTVEAIAALDRVRALSPAAIYTGHDLQPCLRPAA